MSFARQPGIARPESLNRTRLLAGAAAVALTVGGLTACSDTAQPASIVLKTEGDSVELASPEDAGAATAAASELAFESSDIAVVGNEDDAGAVAEKSLDLEAPGLIVGEDDVATADELERLGVTAVFVPEGQKEFEAIADLDVITYDPESLEVQEGEAPEEITRDGGAAAATLFVTSTEGPTPGQEVASATIEAASGNVAELPDGDPRATSETVEAAKASDGGGVLALGEDFGDPDTFTARLATARTAPELPGGGQIAFPGRRMVAAYGSPNIPELGVLGEQDLDESVDLVKELAAEYEDYSDEPVIPAMEIITTVASSEAGPDGNYSTELSHDTLKPWIDRAGEEGIYVVLDLQPGTSTFLEQAQMYEDLLKEPHVGLALDSEWRLEEGQRHMAQIGSVDAAEVNETADWLAELTAENDLPQKVFVMHQFSMSMITDRQDLDTSHEELAMILHADGHGTPDLKMGTWNALQEGLPKGIGMAWKNFYDEDSPTFTPEQTMDVEPKPWFVSYQ
ncbi:MAG: hypothetical protein ACTH1Z_11735 [Ancrocorticia sp.]|uniref:hypothetical protein n=1 Tax=Ancrocorticia sp. TaxID=2593684 RepID=UPI003F90D230